MTKFRPNSTKQKSKSHINVDVDEEKYKLIQQLAKEHQISIREFCRQCINFAISRLPSKTEEDMLTKEEELAVEMIISQIATRMEDEEVAMHKDSRQEDAADVLQDWLQEFIEDKGQIQSPAMTTTAHMEAITHDK